jgi:hypothetical protein
MADRSQPRSALGRRRGHLAADPPAPADPPPAVDRAAQSEERVMLNVRVPKTLRKRLAQAKLDLEVDMEVMVAEAVSEWLEARGH